MSAFTLLIEPCGLWHDEHDILPSRTGMCATARSVFTTCTRWQAAHTCVSVGFASWFCIDCGVCTLWQVVQLSFRAAWVLASQPACVPRLWQVRQVSLTSAGFSCLESLDVPLGVVVDVRLARTVAALAAERGRGRAGILGLAVPRVRDALRCRLMTEDAGVRAGVAGRQLARSLWAGSV